MNALFILTVYFHWTSTAAFQAPQRINHNNNLARTRHRSGWVDRFNFAIKRRTYPAPLLLAAAHGDESAKPKKSNKTSPSNREIQDQIWQTRYHALIAFKKQHGHCQVPQHYPPDPKLGSWVMTTRRYYKLNKNKELTERHEKRRQMLDEAGFVFTVDKIGRPKKSKTAISKSIHDQLNNNTQNQIEQFNLESMHIQFSRVFQRHVVYNTTNSTQSTVIQSFDFLDEATQEYPGVKILAPKDLPFPPPTCSIDDVASEKHQKALYVDECESTLAGMGITSLCELQYPFGRVEEMDEWVLIDSNGKTDDLGYRVDQAKEAICTLIDLIETTEFEIDPRPNFEKLDYRRFALRGMTSDMIRRNYNALIELMDRKLAMKRDEVEFLLCSIPQLSLYKTEELEELVNFLIAPLPPEKYVSVYLVADNGDDGPNVDWPLLASKGYGAGLKKKQAATAILVIPQLLALYYTDSIKPSITDLYKTLEAGFDPEIVHQVSTRLEGILEGTGLSDLFLFTLLAHLGVSSKQMRILAVALRLWRNCNLEPSWEILNKGFKSTFKRSSLDYFRLRLQVSPNVLHKIIKTHPIVTSYDTYSNAHPTLNKLQRNFGLTSGDIRKLMFKQSSLLGLSLQNIDEKLEFFLNEAGMSKEQIRSAIIKDPPFITYSIQNTLRPKIKFFVHELGIQPSLLPRIISMCPPLIGYSLTNNIRPKVCYLMNQLALNQYQVGVMVATSPPILALSQQFNIEPTLSRIFELLEFDNTHDFGKFVLQGPRMLLHSVASLDGKFDLLVESLQSRDQAINAIRNSPSLLTWNVNDFRRRIERTLDADRDLLSSLNPKGRRPKLIERSFPNTTYSDAIIVSEESPSFESITMIYPDIDTTAKESGMSQSTVAKAIKTRQFVQGNYFSSITNFQKSEASVRKHSPKNTSISISLCVSAGLYPRDSIDRDGGICIQVINRDMSKKDYKFLVNDFHIAAASCLGVLIPNPTENAITLFFPMIKISKDRCDLYSIWTVLKVVECYIEGRRGKGDHEKYDIKIFSDSNYAINLLRKDRLFKLGSSFNYSKEFLSQLGMKRAYPFVDILHPLARVFSRLNGQDEPPQSRYKKVDNASVQLFHSNLIQDQRELTLKTRRYARAAAKWQYNTRDRQLRPRI